MKSKPTSGFSLIEVLFTLVIISVAAMAIAKSGLTNMAATASAIQNNTANLLAESILNESLTMPGNKINRAGSELINKTRFQWQAQTDIATVSNPEMNFSTEMTRVTVTVNWNNKSVTLRQYLCQQPEQKAQP